MQPIMATDPLLGCSFSARDEWRVNFRACERPVATNPSLLLVEIVSHGHLSFSTQTTLLRYEIMVVNKKFTGYDGYEACNGGLILRRYGLMLKEKFIRLEDDACSLIVGKCNFSLRLFITLLVLEIIEIYLR